MAKPIRVIDKRNKHYFMVDDAYLNGYARYLGPIVSMVYISLCRHVDFVNQSAFPSQEMIAKEIGVGLRSVENSIATLRERNLISIERERTERRWARNIYYLLDKKVWKAPSPAFDAVDPSPANHDIDHPHHMHTKDTHDKDTHTLSTKTKKYSSLKDITDDDLLEISERYHVPLGFVKLSLESLRNYCEAKGKRYKNYKAALRNFVLGDAKRQVERRSNDPKRGIDARGL